VLGVFARVWMQRGGKGVAANKVEAFTKRISQRSKQFMKSTGRRAAVCVPWIADFVAVHLVHSARLHLGYCTKHRGPLVTGEGGAVRGGGLGVWRSGCSDVAVARHVDGEGFVW
jgi:hypothetical protein